MPLPFLFSWLAAWLAAAAPAPTTSGPTLAREDTLHTEVSEVLVSAPRVTLDEILDRVARGEARRDSLMHDQSFRTTLRMVVKTASPNPQLFLETVSQVYKKRPDKVRSVLLRKWRLKPEKGDKGDDMQLDFGPDMSEEVVNFAFQPSARRDFKYRIVGRDLVGSHLIYRIAFTPRSPLDPTTPSGLVWVDTNDFVIVRQEVGFDRSPVPLILKGVPRMVIERTRVGEYWVLKRLLMRAQTTVPLPKVGNSFDFAVTFDDYVINQGLSDSLFTVPGATRGAAASGR